MQTLKDKKYIDSLDAYREVRGVRETAIEERNIEIAKRCFKKALSIQDTCDLTGLDYEQVELIYLEMSKFEK